MHSPTHAVSVYKRTAADLETQVPKPTGLIILQLQSEDTRSQPLQEIPNFALGLTNQPPVVLERGKFVGTVPKAPVVPSSGA